MSNPLQRLRQLPWLALALISILTIFWAFVLEFFLWVGAIRLAAIQNALNVLYAPPLDLLIEFAVAVGVGVLAVYLLEAVCPQVVINAGVLWALFFCLILASYGKSFLPLPISLVNPTNQVLPIGMLLGVFWKGKPYWR